MKNVPSADGYTYINAPNCLQDGDDEDFVEYIERASEVYICKLEKGIRIRHFDCFGRLTGKITTIDSSDFIKKHNAKCQIES